MEGQTMKMRVETSRVRVHKDIVAEGGEGEGEGVDPLGLEGVMVVMAM
jgi:hypothetical protein